MNSANVAHGTESDVLRVAQFKKRCTVLGPGTRAVVWFHGCSLNCHGCIAYEMNRSHHYMPFTTGELFHTVHSIEGIEGVTLTGGDPFDQPKWLLLEFLRDVRMRTDLSVMCYTGRTLRELQAADDAGMNARILACIDILVDGPYDESLNVGQKWRGSANQELHFLTNRYVHLQDELSVAMDRSVEIDLSVNNTVAIAGIPEAGFLRRLSKRLDACGISLTIAED